MQTLSSNLRSNNSIMLNIDCSIWIRKILQLDTIETTANQYHGARRRATLDYSRQQKMVRVL